MLQSNLRNSSGPAILRHRADGRSEILRIERIRQWHVQRDLIARNLLYRAVSGYDRADIEPGLRCAVSDQRIHPQIMNPIRADDSMNVHHVADVVTGGTANVERLCP